MEEHELAFNEVAPGISFESVFATQESPPPPRPAGHGDLLDLGVGPGLVQWIVLEYGPGREYSMHHTDSIDFDIVLSGSIDLVLDDGTHPLVPGDCVVMTGVDHAWRAGPDGCRISVITLGTPPPA